MVKNPPANAGDLGSIPGLGRSPGEGNGYPLRYSCLENPTDRGTWRATQSTRLQSDGHNAAIKSSLQASPRIVLVLEKENWVPPPGFQKRVTQGKELGWGAGWRHGYCCQEELL